VTDVSIEDRVMRAAASGPGSRASSVCLPGRLAGKERQGKAPRCAMSVCLSVCMSLLIASCVVCMGVSVTVA